MRLERERALLYISASQNVSYLQQKLTEIIIPVTADVSFHLAPHLKTADTFPYVCNGDNVCVDISLKLVRMRKKFIKIYQIIMMQQMCNITCNYNVIIFILLTCKATVS